MFTLRPFQKEALDALEKPTPLSQEGGSQNHVLCIAPTGSGKSLIYETAASTQNRRTVLITPLVALARQQFNRLKETGIPVSLGAGQASLGPPPGKTGAWIMSPEMLHFPSRRKALSDWGPNLLVVDECHCLWEWGETFRPAFSLIPELIKDYSIHQSLWLTATLPYEARLQLRETLPSSLQELGQFELPKKLQLFIENVQWENRSSTLLNWIHQQTEPGILFVSTRESTQRLARLIEATGKKALAYHGGMSAEERKNAESLVSLKIPDVIVATSAFGMGMDYPHLRYVVLWQTPTSLLSLVQTIGRVGRNENKEGRALVFWDYEDFRLLQWTVKNSEKRRKELSELLQFLKTNQCRRATLKLFFDRTQVNEPCNQCDYCIGSHYSNTQNTHNYEL